MWSDSNPNLFLPVSTRDMSPSPMTLCPWWICGDFPFSPQPSQTVWSDCRHFTERKHSSYIQDGTEQMPASSLPLTDLNCSQREQRCELFYFSFWFVFCFALWEKICILLHFPSKQLLSAYWTKKPLARHPLCFCQYML